MEKIMPVFIFLSFMILGCGSTEVKNLKKTPPFTISQAYYQDWIAGVRGGGSGTNVHIIFKDLSEDISIQDIYFRNKKEKAQRSSENKNEYVGFFKNEVNEVKDVIMDSNPQKEAQNTPPKNTTFDLQPNEAVISYLSNGKVKYHKISELEEKQTTAYPVNRKGN